MGALARRDYPATVVASLTVLRVTRVGWGLAPPEGLLPLLSVGSALAAAETSDDVADVFEAYAAPVKSYQGKRGSRSWYATVNGYVGLGAGSERVSGESQAFYGMSVPVGLEFGHGLRSWSISAFLQLIDLGALASYRVTASDEDLETDPEVGVAQVFSPGAYLVVGLPKFPVVLGGGINYAPSLRKVSDQKDEQKGATRVGVFVSIDIPIVRLR
ncbi:MAG: hypothetical protein IPK12_19705 [Gemmatimonadetes bacterium]|nr:hypothetical protein [Gemmatimonadota bacterium]